MNSNSNRCKYIEDDIFGSRLLISSQADVTELADNIRAARAILTSFPEVEIIVNEHVLAPNHKNPEYTIDGVLGDRKGIHSEHGISEAFNKGKAQGCKIIVLDLDMHMSNMPLRDIKLAKELYFRNKDFLEGQIESCYVVYHDKAVVLNPEDYLGIDKEFIKFGLRSILQKIAE